MFFKIHCYLKNLINSYYFPILSALIGGISFVLGIQLIGFIFVVLFGCYTLIIQKNATPIIPLILTFIISIRELSHLTSIFVLISLFTPSIICIVYHFVKYKSRFQVTSLFPSLIIFSIVNFMGGIGSPFAEYYFEDMGSIISAGIVPLVLYFFFSLYLNNDEKLDVKKYWCITIISLCLVIVVESIAMRTESLYSIFDNGIEDVLHTGWLNVVGSGFFFILGTGACLYLITNRKTFFIFFAIIVVFITLLKLLEVDGGFGTAIILLPFGLLFAYQRCHKCVKKYFNFLIFALIVAYIIFCSISLYLPETYDYFIKHFLNDTGRSEIYYETYILFKTNPFFGGSFGAISHVNTRLSGYIHSSFLGFLFTTGIVGFLCYVYYMFNRIKIFIKNDSDFNFFMFFAFLGFQAYASIDCAECMYLTVPITLLTVCVEVVNKSNPQNELPLIKQVI